MITDLDIEKLKKIFLQKLGTATQVITSIIQWTNIIGKPTVFPPDTHTHVKADVTDLNEGLVGTKEVDETSIADEKILEYDTTSGKLIYVDKPTASGFFNKLDATTAPTVNDDSGDGYEIGSLWIDITNDLIYQCADATVGSAVWKCLSSVILDDAPSDGQTYGRKNGNWFTITSGAEPTLILSLGINDWLGLYAIDFGTSTIIIPS